VFIIRYSRPTHKTLKIVKGKCLFCRALIQVWKLDKNYKNSTKHSGYFLYFQKFRGKRLFGMRIMERFNDEKRNGQTDQLVIQTLGFAIKFVKNHIIKIRILNKSSLCTPKPHFPHQTAHRRSNSSKYTP